MLETICGEFHPDLETAFLERLRSLKEAHPMGPLAVVAPSRRLADRLERLAAVEGGLAVMGARFHTFYSLACAVAEDEGWPDGRLVSDPVFLDRLVDGLLNNEPAIGQVFGGASRPRALASALRSSLKDLIDAGVDAAGLEEHFGAELLEEPRERERLGALLRLKSLYEGKLEGLGLIGASELTRLAAVRAGQSRYLFGLKAILYYGFYDLTGLQLEFFEAVTSLYPSTLFFPYHPGRPAYRFAEPFYKEKLAGKNPRQLDSGTAKPGAFEVLSASGARDEVWACAKEILRLTEQGICAYEDIGVAARTLEPYRAALSEVFAESAIPLDLGTGQPVLREPAAKTALNLLTLRWRDFPASGVQDILASPYFARRPGGRTAWHWREAIKRLGIGAGWLQWRKLEGRLREDLPLGGEDSYRVPAADLRGLWDLVCSWRDGLGVSGRSWSELAQAAETILAANLALPEGAKPSEEAAWDAVLEAVRSLAFFDRLGEKPTWESFLESLEAKLKRAAIETGKPPRGVRARDVMDARGESFKVLFLIGLKEGLFPRQVREDPLLRDSARQALREPAGYWIGRKSAGHEEERLLFHLAVSSAREKLYCVFPRSDESGKACVPSLYLRELCRAAGKPLEETQEGFRTPRDPVERLKSRPYALLSPKEASLRLSLEGAQAGDYWDAAGRDGALIRGCLERLPVLTAWGKPGVFDGIVGAPKDYLEEVRQRGLSPSALDTLSQCPFKFFAERLLGLGRREETAEKGEFAAWVKGRIYHEALQGFYSRLSPRHWEGEDWSAELADEIKEVFARYDWRTMGVYPVLWRSARDSMGETLGAFIAWDMRETRAAGMRPLWLEKELSAAWPGPAPKGLEGLKVMGRLDRLDADPARKRFRVVDYKKSQEERKKLSSLVLDGRLNQLPVYAELAREALGGGASLDSARLCALEPKTPGDWVRVYEAKEWESDREAFYERLARRLEAVAKGRFTIKPQDGDHGYCSYCGLASLCRKSHGPSRARAAAAEPA